MTYQVLARKYRPRDFSEMVGQEHVLQALINALDHDRLHHAFLFTGTRGVGKTTIARILAKSLNCEQGVSSKPCGDCSACTEIDEGRFVDLIEVDAASRTGVDDTRELLENVQYTPARGRYKVYLVDEVHMLSKSAFNALLKTLEEPPPHVKFLLATTDPQRIPVTVLSRCLQFNLKRLPLASIQERLAAVCVDESVAADEEAVDALARAADGSMRDGLSLLDQAIAFGGGEVRAGPTGRMLGTIERDFTMNLVAALAAADAAAVMDLVERMDGNAPDYSRVLGDLAAMVQRIALAQVVAEPEEDERPDKQAVAEAAGRWAAEDLQLIYQIALLGRRDLPLAPDPRSGFEMSLLRMLHFRPGAAVPAPAASGGVVSTPPPAASAAAGDDVTAASAGSDATAASAAAGADSWPALIAAMGLSGVARELAESCELVARDERRLALRLDRAAAFLATADAEARLRAAVAEQLGGVQLQLEQGEVQGETPARRRERAADERQQQAQDSVRSDPNVRALEEQFGAQVVIDAVRPAGDEH